MQDKIFMRIQDDIPNTHSFIYKNKKYPFNFYFFKLSSKYFLRNQEEIEKKHDIELIDDEIDGDIILNEETIQNFIDYVHRRTISVTNENVCELNFLSQKYEVESLKNPTEEYISDHRSDLTLQFLIVHQNDSKVSTEIYEEIISGHLEEFIKDDRMLNLKIPILSRILTKYSKKQSKQKEEEEEISNDDDDDEEEIEEETPKEILHFLLNCVDKYGRDASVLFENIKFGKYVDEIMEVIVTKYSQIIDFNFIEKINLKSFYENQTQRIEKEINLRKDSEQNYLNIQKQLNETQNQMELDKIQLEETKSKLDEYEEINKIITNQLDETNTQNNSLNENLNKSLKQINELNAKINELKKKNEILMNEKIDIINELAYKMDIDEYEIKQRIKKGGMVNVFKAVNKKTKKIVALKAYIDSNEYKNWNDFYVTVNISRLGLPGILKIGRYRAPLSSNEQSKTKNLSYQSGNKKIDLSGYIIVTDFMDNGNIEAITREYLKSNGANKSILNPTVRSKIIFGVACTMKQLHKRNVIHRNLSFSNILLDDNLEPRIGSFSLSKFTTQTKENDLGGGTPFFMAPETFDEDYEGYSFPSDVYSFSVILYLMFSVYYPFCDINKTNISPQNLFEKITDNKRASRPAYITDDYWELIQRCWAQDPDDRPTFEEITEILKDDKYAINEFGMATNLEQLHEYQKRIDIDN